MSRRDTIIVAVLINTGLLAVLFLMAMHTETTDIVPITEPSKEVAEIDRTPSPALPENKTEAPLAQVAARDELDQVLQNFKMAPKEEPEPEPVQVKKEPVSQPSKPVVSEEKFVEVTVKRGDYLEKIAKANGTTVSAVMRANNLPNARIDVGQVLRIPVGEKGKLEEKPKRKEVAVAEPQYYTMRSGDNPWKVAKQFHVRFDDLLKLNDLDEDKARSLKPGDVLRVK